MRGAAEGSLGYDGNIAAINGLVILYVFLLGRRDFSMSLAPPQQGALWERDLRH